MGKAFDMACERLRGEAHELAQEAIAQCIIDAAATGERDPETLCAKALDTLGLTRR